VAALQPEPARPDPPAGARPNPLAVDPRRGGGATAAWSQRGTRRPRPLVMRDLALVLLTLYGLITLLLRVIVQLVLTGSTGIRGISGRAGSPEWLAGILFTLAIALSVVGAPPRAVRRPTAAGPRAPAARRAARRAAARRRRGTAGPRWPPAR